MATRGTVLTAWLGARLIHGLFFSAAALAPMPALAAPPVLTVCEVLTDLDLYRGQNIVIVASSGWTFEGSFLHERCEADDRILVQGHPWPSLIQLATAERPAFPTDVFPVDDVVIREKLSHMSKYRSQDSARAEREPGATPRTSAHENWVAIYGTLESPRNLREPVPWNASDGRNKPGNGYGANGSVPARILVIKSKPIPPKGLPYRER